MQMAEATKHLHQLLKLMETAEENLLVRHGSAVPRTTRAFDIKTIAALKAYTGGLPPVVAQAITAPGTELLSAGPDAYLAGITAKQGAC